MDHAIRVRMTVGEDRTIRLPDEVPAGDAEIIVVIPASAEIPDPGCAEARKRLFGVLRGQITIADDFDAPLPDEILRDFEGPVEP